MGRAKRITQILIADGNMLFRHGLRTLLSAESGFHVMDAACDASEALAKVRVSPPDVLVMDLALVGGRRTGDRTRFTSLSALDFDLTS